MRKTKIWGMLVLTALVGAVGCDQAEEADQDRDPAAAAEPLMPQEMDPQVMEQVQEIEAIQAELAPINQQALQDEALAARLQEVQQTVEAAMREENPELLEGMDRFQEQVAEAQAAGNQEQLQVLMTEAQALQQEMQALQTAVLQRPEIREEIEGFEAAHRARMIEIDPEAEALLDRMDELVAGLAPQAGTTP